jgi:PhzF family phenazine biosynthesis protein
MKTEIYHVDAFADRLFGGNPAAVMPLPAFPDDATLLAVAAENHLPATAFLVREGGDYRIRWFTALAELSLCGHATLASATVIMERLEPARTEVIFHSAGGILKTRREDDRYVMDMPVQSCAPVEAPPGLAAALGTIPRALLVNDRHYLALLEDEAAVRGLAPDMEALRRLDRDGLIVTAQGEGRHDFVSRYFVPAKGIPEDMVTGSAHCTLVPYWAARTGRSSFLAYQASARGGELSCELLGDRVELGGTCLFYLEGMAELG